MNSALDPQRLRAALASTTTALLSEIGPGGHWSGDLSSSALSTAVATIALGRMGHSQFIAPGLQWLATHANADGGWGDTTRSQSNLSTTALVWAAFGSAGKDKEFSSVVQAAEAWIWKHAGTLENLPTAIADLYGEDRTFSVPILMTLALSGRLGPWGWQKVPNLPFELAAFPQKLFGALQLPVVSYALPALIAIGQTIHHHAPSRNPVASSLRNFVKAQTLEKLNHLQPPNGGFLEATPLTAFVTMSLASMEQRDHPVARRGASFLRASIRPDGSWPIDTNLATWTTTLAIKALPSGALSASQQTTLRDWLLAQQYHTVHPYTGAAPGGWAWTDLPGGVPDADDTAGALVALHCLKHPDASSVLPAAQAGVKWLLDLQNRDGGIPTFCRGWGKLPFDRSAPELTAHALRAWARWEKQLPSGQARQIRQATRRAENYLAKVQCPNGAWIPLWFGNEAAPRHENPVYGSAQTLISLNELGISSGLAMRGRAAHFLIATQLPSGGWGGDLGCPETLEETALAVEALAGSAPQNPAFLRGAHRLLDLVENRAWNHPAPIGLYFARLWYFERLYPLVFATGALQRLASQQL